MTDPERPAWYPRAYQLFAEQFFDSDNAVRLARSEFEQRQRLDADARRDGTGATPGRMTGAERDG